MCLLRLGRRRSCREEEKVTGDGGYYDLGDRVLYIHTY